MDERLYLKNNNKNFYRNEENLMAHVHMTHLKNYNYSIIIFEKRKNQ